MAEIVPRGQIHLLKNVPLHPDYINTFWFNSDTEQYQWFQNNYANVTFQRTSYQRKNRGWLRVEASYLSVYQVSYMMWKNAPATAYPPSSSTVVRPGYEDKWWYAFVDQIDYINDNCVEIHYTLDVIQSYMFDVQFEDTFVERICTRTDAVGDNLIDEGLPIGEYTYSTGEQLTFAEEGVSTPSAFKALGDEMHPIIAATVTADYHDSTESTQEHPINTTVQADDNGMIAGCLMIDPEVDAGYHSDPRSAQTWLRNLPGAKQGAVLGIVMCPVVMSQISSANIDGPARKLFTMDISRPQTLNGYHPTNNKLHTFPYNAMQVVSSDGSSMTYAWEFFGDTPSFALNFVYTFPIQGILYPTDTYKGGSIKALTTLPLPTLPTCSWSNDTYKAWAAMNTGFIATSIAGSVVDAAVRAGDVAHQTEMGGSSAFSSTKTAMLSANAAAGITGLSGKQVSDLMDATQAGRRQGLREGLADNAVGITNDILNVTNQLIKIHNAKILPDAFNGSASNLATAVTTQRYGFFWQQVCVREDYARQLDDYFTMFGYKVNRIMTISKTLLNNRTRFTYIKTMNMDVGGLIPADDKETFCAVFNKGIRFWYDKTSVGNYTSANNPRG